MFRGGKFSLKALKKHLRTHSSHNFFCQTGALMESKEWKSEQKREKKGEVRIKLLIDPKLSIKHTALREAFSFSP